MGVDEFIIINNNNSEIIGLLVVLFNVSLTLNEQ